MGSRAARAAVEVGMWWAVCEGIWALTLSSLSTAELVVAAACGLPCAVVTRIGRRNLLAEWHPDPRWLRWLPVVAAAVLVDTVRLFRLAVRPGHVEGRLEPVQLPDERSARANARGALAAIALTATPGSYVMDTDTEDADLLLHRLVGGAPHVSAVVTR